MPIRTFIRSINQYVEEVQKRAQQVVQKDEITLEPADFVQFKFCVDAEWIEQLTSLGFTENISSFKDLTDDFLRKNFKEKNNQSTEFISLKILEQSATKKVRTSTNTSNATSHTENLLVSCHAMLQRHALSWLFDED